MEKIKIGSWFIFLSGEEDKLDRDRCGNWMYFFDNQEYAKLGGFCPLMKLEGTRRIWQTTWDFDNILTNFCT